MRNAVEADIERALANRTIIRTWPMRGTMHFVAAADVRWMLELMTPRILANIAQCFLRRFDLDERAFARSKELFDTRCRAASDWPEPQCIRCWKKEAFQRPANAADTS